MKNNLLPGGLAACLLLHSAAMAEETATPEMVEIEVHFIKATDAQMTDILGHDPQLMNPNPPVNILALNGVLFSDEAAKILQKLKTAGAEIVSTPKTVTMTGKKARVQNVREFRYPSKYSEPSKDTGKVIPVAFETKNTGISMEFEPKAGPDGVIELSVSLQVTDLKDFVDYSDPKTANTPQEAQANTIWQPVFQNREITTQATVYTGQTLVFCESGGAEQKSGAKRNAIFVTVRAVPEQ